MNHYLLVGGSQKTAFLYLIDDWKSSAIVKKHLLKALSIVIMSVKSALLLMTALGDVSLEILSEPLILPEKIL